MIPVYIINGFLESGKSTFIRFTLGQKYFQIPERTLLIVCEEGEVEYEKKLLRRSGTDMVVIEDQDDFTQEALEKLVKEYKPGRIVIELNGMWNPKELKYPAEFEIEQQITTINAATFSMYYTNMKSLVSEHVRASEMIIFNRCDDVNSDLPNFKRSVRAVNSNAEIIFEDAQGEVNVSLDEDLPYDLSADVIELDDTGYALFYIDVMDNPERYNGKVLSYKASVLKSAKLPKGYMVTGRRAMTCCADDIAFLGYACKCDKASEFKDQDFVKIKGKLKLENLEAYGGMGPVLYVDEIEKTSLPKDDVIDFSNL